MTQSAKFMPNKLEDLSSIHCIHIENWVGGRWMQSQVWEAESGRSSFVRQLSLIVEPQMSRETVENEVKGF